MLAHSVMLYYILQTLLLSNRGSGDETSGNSDGGHMSMNSGESQDHGNDSNSDDGHMSVDGGSRSKSESDGQMSVDGGSSSKSESDDGGSRRSRAGKS